MSDHHRNREALREIAESTMKAIERGAVRTHDNTHHTLHTQAAIENTCFFHPHSLSPSKYPSAAHCGKTLAYISILGISTVHCCRLLTNILRNNHSGSQKIGVLNFASATSPGGGFLNGAQAQEESIARSSTLYPTLRYGTESQKFYRLHNENYGGHFYTNAMIYSPDVELFRDDDGTWIAPIPVDVLTCAAVNAGGVRGSKEAFQKGRWATENHIKSVMKERMARILYLFELWNVRNIVLGSFGTGVFCNDVDVVAKIWVDLLSAPNARFSRSFDRVMFAIMGRKTFTEFEKSFNGRKRT